MITNAGPVPINGVRRQVLLATLLLHANKVISIDRLIDSVWPHHAPRSAVENIRTYVYELRSQFRRAGDAPRLERHPGAYRLRADPDELDLIRFSALATAGQGAMRSGDFEGAAGLLAEATGLWRGTPLSGLEFGVGIQGSVAALEEQRRLVQSNWIKSKMALGEHEELIPLLRQVVMEYPLDENVWCYLAIALQSMGRVGEALAACMDARHVLAEELGVVPGAELRRIQAAVLRGSPVVDPDLSPQRARPSNILVTSALSGAVPSLLPAPVPDIAGRQVPLNRLTDILSRPAGVQDGAPRGITVSVIGPPGVGKTATAVSAAFNARSAFPDGQLFVDLKGSSSNPVSPFEALGTLLGGLGLDADYLPKTFESRSSVYQSLVAERRILILLDDVADTKQVAALVARNRGAVLMTCGRWLPSLTIDATITIDSLDREGATEMLCHLVGAERGCNDPEAADAIVEACGGLPLAIRIAGMRLAARPLHPLRTMARQLSERPRVLDELSMGELSIRDRFAAAYQQLTPAVQRSFGALGLTGSATYTARSVAELLHMPLQEADWTLEQLVHSCMLTTSAAGEGTTTYNMPSLLHVFAREQAIDSLIEAESACSRA